MATPNPDTPKGEEIQVEESEVVIEIPDAELNIAEETPRRIEETQGKLDALDDAEKTVAKGHLAKEVGKAKKTVDLGLETFNERSSKVNARNGIKREKDLAREQGESITDEEATQRNIATQEKKGRDIFAGVREDDGKEIQEQKRQKFDRATGKIAEELGLPPDAVSLPQIADLYFGGDKETKEKILRGFRSEYSEEEAKQMLAGFGKEDVKAQLDTIRAAKFMNTVAKKDQEKFKKMMEAEDIDSFIREQAQSGDALFKEFVHEQERSNQLRENALRTLRERSGEETSTPTLSKEASAALSGIPRTDMDSLDQDEVSALNTVVERGGGPLLRAFLPEASRGDLGFTGMASGQRLLLDRGGDLYLIGREAHDQGNQGKYRIDPPTIARFEEVFIHAFGEQEQIGWLAESPVPAKQLYRVFEENPDDRKMPDPAHLREFGNFAILVCGQGKGRVEQEVRLRKLGVLGDDGVNESQVVRFRRLIAALMRSQEELREKNGGLGLHQESPNIVEEDLVTAAELWRMDPDAFPDSLDDLKTMTKNRLSGKGEWREEKK